MTIIAAMRASAGLPAMRGKRTVLVYGGGRGAVLKLLDDLTDDEVSAKLPVQLGHLPQPVAA